MKTRKIWPIFILFVLTSKNIFASHGLAAVGEFYWALFLGVLILLYIGSIISLIFSIIYYKKQKKGHKIASIVLMCVFDFVLLIIHYFLLNGIINYLYDYGMTYAELYAPLAFFIFFIGLLLTKIFFLKKKPKVNNL